MKKLFLGMAAVLAASTTTLAADLPIKSPVPATMPVPVIFSWTGCYIGAEGGGNWGRSEQIARSGVLANTTITGKFDLSGGIAGGTVGCNLQTSNFVVGIESDFSWTNKQGSLQDLPPFNVTTTSSTREKWIDTSCARASAMPGTGSWSMARPAWPGQEPM
jgi:outer membrane immunogenic protein